MEGRQRLFLLEPGVRENPLRLLWLIVWRVYAEVWMLPVGGALVSGTVLAAAGWALLHGGRPGAALQTALWLWGLFPLTISLEEFFHAATCVGRGKADRLHGLVAGRYYLGRLHLGFQFTAVDIRGKLNAIDKLYISAGGPVLAWFCMAAGWGVLRAGSWAPPLRTALAVLAAVPLVGLIPNTRVVRSDGHSVLDAARRLRLPNRFLGLEMGRSAWFALRWLARPWRKPSDEFVSPAAAYDEIARAMAAGDTETALEWYRRLARIDPYNPEVLNNLAWLLAGLGRHTEAAGPARRALRLAPGDPDIRDTWDRVREGA